MSNDHLSLKGSPEHWAEDTQSENLKYSVIDFYKWAFLNIGAYQNITQSPTVSGVGGGDRSRLSYTKDPRFTDGQVWQGHRADWVWETGVAYSPAPQTVNVYVNGVEKETNDATYGHYIDYPRGRVVFTTPVSSTVTVKADFAHRTVGFVPTTEPWFREIMYNSYDIKRDDFLNSAEYGGKWNNLGETRLQLPAVGVEVVGTPRLKPYQLGGGNWQYLDILYYIYAEDAPSRNKIRDLLTNQEDKVIWLYDRGRMKEDARWPFTLDYRGSPITNFLTYPSLVAETDSFRYVNAKFTNTRSEDLPTANNWLYGAVVRTTAEIIMPYG